MTPREVKQHLSEGREIVILDVREPFELEICHVEGALHIPMRLIANSIDKLPKNKEIVVMCHRGIRSLSVINFLEEQGIRNVHNMHGGIARWAEEVDTNMKKY